MAETIREKLLRYEKEFRTIMEGRIMPENDKIVFQYALDSISYILKSQNMLDDKWVAVGFENIKKANELKHKIRACKEHTKSRFGFCSGESPRSEKIECRKPGERNYSIRRTPYKRSIADGVKAHGGLACSRFAEKLPDNPDDKAVERKELSRCIERGRGRGR